MKCKKCNNEIDETRLSKYASGDFCSTKCAKSYSQSKVNTQSLKEAFCSICNEKIGVKKNTDIKRVRCNKCKNICKHCGQSPCKRPDVCKRYRVFPSLSKYFGFDESKIGTIAIYEEIDRVKNLLVEDYGNNELSIKNIRDKYGIKQYSTTSSILKSLDVQIRSIENATVNAGKNGRMINNIIGSNFKCGGHKTGNGKDVFYRSSYELEYAQQLDEQQIDYDMENLRILYGDSQKYMQRVAIPDFYLPESNTIVEIKSDYTYDEQNMKDRFRSYKLHGYNYKLILEKQEINI